MDFRLPPDVEEFRQEVKDFIQKELPESYRSRELFDEEENEEVATAFRKKLANEGWLTIAWPKEYGGMGADHLRQLVYNEEMAYRGAPMGDQGVSMLGPTLMIHGSEELKEKFLPPITRAEMRWCQGYSEPESGSDLASLQTSAVEDGDDFVINGSKIWNSSAHHADWIFFLARTDQEAPKHRGISFLLADLKSPGLTVRPIISMAGVHSFNQIFFDNVRVPKHQLVGELNRGWYVAMTLLDFERSGVARSAQARRVLEELVQYTQEVKVNGKTLSEDPLVRRRLADLAIEIGVSHMMSQNIAWMQSQGIVPNMEASVGKLFGSELTQRLYSTGLQILGLYGQLEKDAKWAPLKGRIERGWLLSFSSTIAGGTSEIQRNIIATRGLGLPRG